MTTDRSDANGDSRERVTSEFLRLVAALVLNNAAVAARLGLGVSDLQVLGLVQRAERLSAGELARLTGLTTGSVTGLVDRLAKAGYATRTRDHTDRRKVYISADQAGLARIGSHYEQYGRHLAEVLARRSQAQLTIIEEFLVELNDVDTMIAPPPD